MKPGDAVIISFNPHHKCDEKIIGTVKGYHPGTGFRGCDMVDVKYTWPTDGVAYTMPFGIHNLEEVTPEGLLAMAERYESTAAFFRKLAAKISNETK